MRLGDVLSFLAMRTPERFYVEYAAMHQVRRQIIPDLFPRFPLLRQYALESAPKSL
jgi:hypothetical protein